MTARSSRRWRGCPISLEDFGIQSPGRVFANEPAPALVEHAVSRGEAMLADNGALVARTFARTGRSPKDKFTVKDSSTEETVWWGPNAPVSPEVFQKLWEKAAASLEGKDLFLLDAFACADPTHRLGVKVVSELAWHSLFAKQLFRRPAPGEAGSDGEGWRLMSAPNAEADPEADGVNSGAFVSIDFSGRRVLVMGTHYAGEMKKSIFTVLNYVLPDKGVFPMHCSANVGPDGDVALFFGLSGTGKTTLSADPARMLIGDDEHGWSSGGIFNFEGGCYAKCIDLSKEKEPQIWEAIRFGSVVENVVVDPATRAVDYNDGSITENTRAAYPLEFIPGARAEGVAGHASNVVFLTADASGVLPPVARLTRDQAAYHFLSGFTSKLAGTEAGMGDEPEPTFSTCFASPFLPRHPTVYSEMLMDKLEKHDADVYLINTGWTGGPFGVGSRIDIDATRNIVHAALGGSIKTAKTWTDPHFGLEVPEEVAGVPSDILRPRDSWADPAAYDAKAKELAEAFRENFKKFSDRVGDSVKNAGP